MNGKNPVPTGPGPDRLAGFELHEGSRNLGELEELVWVGGGCFFVVDARHWSYGARKLLPVSAVDDIDADGRRVFARLDAEVIRGGPDFDPFLLGEARYIDRVEAYFSALTDNADN